MSSEPTKPEPCECALDCRGAVHPLLSGYDWAEVFKYAHRPEHTHDGVPSGGFCRGMVAGVLSLAEGENDGPSWVAVVRLADGRFGAVEAGCDYTGWG